MCTLNTIPLSKIVKAAAIDLGEDFTKVEATFNHHAVRGFKKLTREILRLPVERVILPIHRSLKTATLPLNFKRVVFVGGIDECGHMYPFEINSKITPHNVAEVSCVDKCKECNQALDICEKLEVTEEKKTVIINGQSYENITYKYLEGGSYYLVKKIWVFNSVTSTVEEITTKDFVTEFDMLKCGCIAPTTENIHKIETHCNECYCCCYAPCSIGDAHGATSYRIFEEQDMIQLDRKTPFEKVYIEFETSLFKKDGVFYVLEDAEETLTYYVVFKHIEHDKSVSETAKDRIWKSYVREKNILQIVLGRISLSSFRQIMYKTPQFNVRGEAGCSTVT